MKQNKILSKQSKSEKMTISNPGSNTILAFENLILEKSLLNESIHILMST
jgi:hypothetical protein